MGEPNADSQRMMTEEPFEELEDVPELTRETTMTEQVALTPQHLEKMTSPVDKMADLKDITPVISIVIAPDEPTMVTPVAPCSLGKHVRVQTNVFGMCLERETTFNRYDVLIHTEGKNGKPIYFTKKGKDDAIVLDRSAKCIAVFRCAMEKYADIFKDDPTKFFYDGQSILFSAIDLFEGCEKKARSLVFEGKSLPIEDLHDFDQIVMDVQVCEKNPRFVLGVNEMRTKTANATLEENDHTIAQFLELVINQKALMTPNEFMCFEYGKVFSKNPGKHGYGPRDCPYVGGKMTLGIGVQKSVKFIEGPRGRNVNNPCVVVDTKKAAFHDSVDLLTKGKAICSETFRNEVQPDNLAKMNAAMKDLFFFCKHLKATKKYQIGALVSETPMKAKFALPDGKTVSIAEYYQTKYNHTLKYPNTPLVKDRALGRETFFPMELCILVPFQRVTIPQQTPQQSQTTVEECAIAPSERQRTIMLGSQAIELLNEDNQYMKNAGLKVFNSPISVDARLMPVPALQYKGAQEQGSGGKWRLPRQGQFIEPADCPVWGLYLLCSNRDVRLVYNDLRQFAEFFVTECKKRGMRIGLPADVDAVNEKYLRMKLEMCGKHGCKFVLFVTPDCINSFNTMKLCEREFMVVTQSMMLSDCLEVIRDKNFLTLENVVLKTNVKLGGHNHSISLNNFDPDAGRWLNSKRMVVGVALSNPPPGAKFEAEKTGSAPPTVVGYAGNFKKHRDEFIGSFAFQVMYKNETTDTLSLALRDLVAKFAKENQTFPEELIVYHAGVDEGSYASILQYEIPLARHTLLDLCSGADVKIVFIVVQKEHNMRFFKTEINPRDSDADQNIPSGIVVDSQVTHPSYKEFYLNSHNTLQGSARTPRYTVLADDLDMRMDELEGMTYGLCFGNQIVTSATSVPTPLYLAGRYAVRGRNLMVADLMINGDTGSSDSSGSSDMVKLTQRLGYSGTELGMRRIIA